jgi:predicted RNA-binding protein with PUA-like domain
MNYWLVKSEPVKYSWEKFVQDKKTFWDGVRNFQARNNLKAMKKGDQVLFYHSNEGKEIVGVAEVVTEFYQDPTTQDPQWVVVDLKPVLTFSHPISLEQIKQDAILKDTALIRQSRLSVMPFTGEQFNRALLLGMPEGNADFGLPRKK